MRIRTAKFVMIPMWVMRHPEVKGNSTRVAVYAGLRAVAWESPGLEWRSTREIAKAVSEVVGVPDETCRKHLGELVRLGIIVKTDDEVITPDDEPGSPSGSPATQSGSPQTQSADAHLLLEKRERKEVSEPSSDATRLCNLLADSIEARGSKRPTVTKAWLTDMDRMIRLDGRKPPDIWKMLHFLADSPSSVAVFWRPNVRSPAKLRERWDQIVEQRAAQMSESTGNPGPVDRAPAGSAKPDNLPSVSEMLRGDAWQDKIAPMEKR